jgi:hypothetical protein
MENNLNKVEFKLTVGDTAWFLNQQGKLISDRVEKVDITIGSSSYRTSHWLETAKTPVKAVITYKFENHPAGFILTENSVYLSKEDLLANL